MANSAAWSCIAATFTLLLAIMVASTQAEYPGVIELVGYSNRRARTHFVPSSEESSNPTLAPPAAKIRADIETVKRNMKKYDRLLALDTKNLPEPQKDMLARIVERVARLKESLDIEELQLSQQEDTSAKSSTTQQQLSSEQEVSTLPPTAQMETETDPTLLLDETTLLELQQTMDEQAALQAAVTAQTTLMRAEAPTTTDISMDTALGDSTSEQGEEMEPEDETNSTELSLGSTTSDDALTDATDPDDQFVAARSNNNIAAITAADADPSTTTTTSAGNQRTLTTMGKLKHRATKRPFGHKSNTVAAPKRGQRPNSVSTAAANAAAAQRPSTPSSGNKQKLSTSSTASTSYQQKLQTPGKPVLQQQNKVSSASATGTTPNLYSSSSSSSSAMTATSNSATPALPLEQLYTRTPQANIPVAALAASPSSTYSSNNNDAIVYDAHVNASAIIDSLNTHAREEYYQQKQTVNNKDNKKTATAKPTKYHYYPHNQHIYLLPECAIQQVCNAVYVRLNYTQPLCACPSRYRDPCSASLNEDDQHTTKLVGDNKKKAITLAKTCEATTEMRECRSPKDWSLLALQNTRTGKSHYLVICRCPDHFKMEGPMAHDQPTYASVPGIRVFGMMCVKPGYSVRKPSSQPPKRYQLQKPFYRPGTQSSYVGVAVYGSAQKDSYGRPIYSGGSNSGGGASALSSNYQPPDQSFQNGGGSSYQYLNRPESTHSHNAPNFRPDQFSINNFPGSNYGRNNERRGDAPIEAAGAEETSIASSTQASDEARTTLQAELSEAVAAAASELAKPTESQQPQQLESRSKRSVVSEAESYEPEFPWDRVLEFQQTIVWD
ncbi:uncharacterized protein LOC115628327 [Scaptodrosophila lebanonensis]|uniref:Uncharacterized protein LOC115628327 n=1 Tax=Drosophila lebanonensis TaxID=7225 RepID=A0A6J2TVU2_DROLE|nr:uncharacterized protein LOC115628327 [Scaptodrosophila lebanonensis]